MKRQGWTYYIINALWFEERFYKMERGTEPAFLHAEPSPLAQLTKVD